MGLVALLFTFLSVGYAHRLDRAQTVALQNCFYYVVDASENVQAVSGFVDLQGGAAYCLETNNRQYVAYAVYLQKEDADAALRSLSIKNDNVQVLSMPLTELVFTSAKEKQRADAVVGAFSCLYGCMQVLNQEVHRLDGGATQQSSRSIFPYAKKSD